MCMFGLIQYRECTATARSVIGRVPSGEHALDGAAAGHCLTAVPGLRR